MRKFKSHRPVPAPFAARVVSQRGGGARRGSEERARDQARGRDFQPGRSLRDRRLRELKTRAPLVPRPSDIWFAARGVSQRGEASRRGSESARGTRLAVEALWPSREPVRRQAQGPEQAEATWAESLAGAPAGAGPEQAEATASTSASSGRSSPPIG